MDRHQAAEIYKDVVIYRTRSDVPVDVAEALDVAVQTHGDDRDTAYRVRDEALARVAQLEAAGWAVLNAKHRDAGLLGPGTLAALGEFAAVLRGNATPAGDG